MNKSDMLYDAQNDGESQQLAPRSNQSVIDQFKSYATLLFQTEPLDDNHARKLELSLTYAISMIAYYSNVELRTGDHYEWMNRQQATIDTAKLFVKNWQNHEFDFDNAVNKIFSQTCKVTLNHPTPNSKERKIRFLLTSAEQYAHEHYFDLLDEIKSEENGA